MKTEFTTKAYVSDVGEYVVEKLSINYFTPIPLTGDAIVTHVGLKKRFKFKLGNLILVTTLTDNIAIIENQSDRVFDYSNVNFNINIKAEHDNLYNNHSDKVNFWKAI